MRKMTGPGRYSDGGNLYLFVKPNGARLWTVRYKMPGGEARKMGLGNEADVTLAEARGRARDARHEIKAGRDPVDAGGSQARSGGSGSTFGEVAALYIKAHEDSWRNAKHRAEWHSTLKTYAEPKMGKVAVGKVAIGHVMDVLEPIWWVTPETASRLRGRIEAVLVFATAPGWRKGENPARWKGQLANLLPMRSKLAAEHHAGRYPGARLQPSCGR